MKTLVLQVRITTLRQAQFVHYSCSIGEDDEAPSEDSVTVIDIVDAHRLKEITLDKKSWTAYIKGKDF